MIETIIYGPVLVMAKYRSVLIRDDDTEADPIEVGEPVIERSGVLGRRAAIGHAFRARHLLRFRKILIANGDFGAPLGLDSADVLPADWRFPLGA